MGIDLRLPNITGPTERERLSQIQSYLFQMVEQLNWALQNVDTSNATVVNPTPKSLMPSVGGSYGVMPVGEGDDPQTTFNSIKSLIIKSADIVEAYYEEINRRLESVYVAQSDFGDFAQRTSQEIEETSTSTIQRFENVQVIISNHDKELSSIEGNLQTIGQELGYSQNEIITIKGDVDGISSSVANLETNIGDLDTDLKETAQTLTQTITDTEDKLTTTITNTKVEIEERIDDTNGSVANLGAGLNDANSRIADVDQDLQEAKENISENIQGVRDSVTGVNALLEDAKAQLQGSLDDLEVYITELQSLIIGVTAYLKSGLLYYTDAGIPVYGIEVGQSVKDETSGVEVFNKYARFTSEKLSFYDSNGIEVAYISDKKLYIRMAHITVAFQIGGLIDLVMANGDVVEKWVGG